jgi:hypothetical protein
MIRSAIATFAALATFGAASLAPVVPGGVASARAADAQTVDGRWAIQHRTPSDGEHVELTLTYETPSDRGTLHHDEWGDTVALSDLGLTAERLRAAVAPVTFRVVRDAGTFACTGTAGNGAGAGQFVYTPNAAFSDALAARAINRPSAPQSVVLAMDQMTIAFIDTYVRPGTPHASLADLLRLAQHGVDPPYADALAAAGETVTSAEALLRMHDHGVSARLVRSLAAAGYRDVSPDDLVRSADHGVTAHFITELAKRGYGHVPLTDVTELADHGVTIAFIDRLSSHGYKDVSVHDLIRLRDSGI